MVVVVGVLRVRYICKGAEFVDGGVRMYGWFARFVHEEFRVVEEVCAELIIDVSDGWTVGSEQNRSLSVLLLTRVRKEFG